MCGIVGYIDGELPSKTIIQSMMHQIVHRGPDQSGIYLDEQIALGHRRLSIIDLSEGVQPMKNEDGQIICIFNGEIYNYLELREELKEKGHTFITESDTEVLLHGYETWGKDLPNRLRGMFSFAIWNRKKQELFCARDFFGIKPFYYYKKEDVFLFGSEIKSFLPHPCFEKRFRIEQLDLYLSYQYSPGETTFFEHVYKLPPAHFLVWKEGKLEVARYWQPVFESEYSKTKEEWELEIDDAVRNSVAVHQISDVEVGSFLSSGVDSNYITALSKVNQTFTIGYMGNDTYDEAKYVKEFCSVHRLENTTVQITPKEFWEKLSDVQYYMDEPLADASCVALCFLNREASRHVKVCLSGEGADELFGGYRIYKEPFMCAAYDRIPQFFRRAIGGVASLFPSVRGVNFLVRHSKPLSDRYIGNTKIFTQKQKKQLLKKRANKRNHRNREGKNAAMDPVSLSRPFFCALKGVDQVTRMQYTDIHLWLAGDILMKADKMSMMHSLELRVPFLDKHVFEVARKIPIVYRVNAQKTKIALRGAAKRHLDKAVADREKWGFPVPVREWLREEPYVSMVRLSFESVTAKEFFRIEWLLELLDEHVSHKKDHWRQIWCIYMFLIWYEEYFIKR